MNENINIFDTCLGSPLYMAPEVLLGLPYGIKADIYSLGVIFYMMLYGDFPYKFKNSRD
jgi:serine/threonine protein kinase